MESIKQPCLQKTRHGEATALYKDSPEASEAEILKQDL
jgi:hypothetical protein